MAVRRLFSQVSGCSSSVLAPMSERIIASHFLQRFQRQRKVGRRRVGGHIGNGIGTVGERGQKVRCAGVPGGGGKLVEAFNVR